MGFIAMTLSVFFIIAYQPVGPVHAQELVHQRLELGQLHLFSNVATTICLITKFVHDSQVQ